MNEEKRQENLVRLQQIFLNRNFVNKTNMLKVVNSSYATAKRREEANIKFDIPEPTHSVEFNRTTSSYKSYQYSIDDLAIFLTDRNFYWQMIEKRQSNEKSI